MKFIEYSFFFYIASFTLIVLFFLIDRRKKRTLKKKEKISILISCYNDGDSIELTIQSVYDSYPKEYFQLIVINDKSTDDSLEKLQNLQKKYGFTLHDNPKNLGKSETLNLASEFAEHEFLLILDADVIIQKKHMHDMLARMQANENIAAVSCPPVPHNKGFLPIMLDLEYVMLDLIQGSYNTFGAISLWGGCLMVKKSAFFEVKKFSSRMMTEDLDLAFKLNKAGYKVQQSIHRFSTFVPNTLKTRYKQKIRRNSGGTHCFIKYPQIWIKNPLHVIMIASFCILIIGLLFRMIKSYDLFVIIFMQENIRQAFRIVFNLKRWFNLLYITISCSLLSLPYTLPLITHRKNLWKIVLIIPYSFVYVPMYSFVGVLGIFKGIQSYRKLEKIGKSGGGIARK